MKKFSRQASLVLVLSQFICILLIVLSGEYYPRNALVLILMMAGIFIGLWAIYSMRLNRLTIMPDFYTGSRLIDSGPYHYIRHPMYLAVLLFCLSMLVNELNTARVIVYAILVTTLIIKIIHEEKQLLQGLPEYRSYKQRTKRLIPFVF